MARVVGIDAGKSGAVAFHDGGAGEMSVEDIELLGDETLDARWLFDRLMEFGPRLAVVEDCFRPQQLVRMVGEASAVCKLLGVELRRIAVVTWKTKMLTRNTSDKKVSIARCQELWPTVDIVRPGGRTPNADRAEAVLMAHYAAGLLTNSSGSSPATSRQR